MRSKFILWITVFMVCTQAKADQWNYSVDIDKMTGKTSNLARISSSNTLDLPFPYSGTNYGTVMVRKHPQYGLDVLVYLTKGQILCNSYNGCTVKVRFGDGAPSTFSATGPADHSSDTIFIRNAQKFIDQAKKTKNIKIQMNVYQAGGQVLEFDSPSPLVWGNAVQPKSKGKMPAFF